MNRFLFFPDGGNAAADTIVTDTHVRHMENVPRKDADLLAVSSRVTDKWAESSFITLLWKTQTNFAADTLAFKVKLQARNTEGGFRGGQTDTLYNLDVQADDAVPYVKAAINAKFGPHSGPSHYPEFGMVHRDEHYELPADRQQRQDAIRMMIDAIAANGLGSMQYGTTFWTTLKTNFDAALADATSGAGNVSADVSDLAQMRTGLRRVLHSILLLLEANYPDTFNQVRRDWGFQKGSY